MAQKVYKRIGLRRDRNLSDLSNSTEALNNMLGDLAAVGGAGDTFISEDLDAIKNSYAQGLTHNDYTQVGGSAVKYWDNATQDQRIFEPRITYQNKLDQFNIFSGNPRLAGGNGLTASYYQNDQVLENTEDIFTGEPFNVDNFWESGNFEWDRKLHPSAINVNGGIQWEGYFVPTDTGLHQFTVNTSGCFTLDFQTEGYQEDDGGNIISVGIETYKEYKRIGIGSTTQGDAANWGSGNNQISIDDADFMKHVAIGQSVTSTGNIADGVNINDISGTTITLTAPESGDAVLSNFSNQDITFSKGVGTPVKGSYTTDYSLEKYRKYRIRFRYFVPQIFDTSGFIRNYDVDYDPPSAGSANLRYNKLFDINYDFTNASKGDINVFLDNSILYGGNTNTTGIGSETDYLEYVKVQTSNKIDVKYDPRNITKASVEKRALSINTTNNSTVISISDTSNLEVGQYIYDTTNTGEGATRVIPEGTRIEQIIINNSIIMSNAATSTATINAVFVEHRGHVQRVVGQSNGTSQIDFTDDYTSNASIMSGRIIIGGNNVNNTKIVMNASSDSIGLSTAMSSTTGSGEVFYIYESEGIVNNSLAGFCDNQTKCVMVRGSSDIPAGTVTIPVRDADSVQTNDRVLGYYFFDNTTVTSKVSNGVNGGGTAGESSNHSITIAVDGDTSTGTQRLVKPGNNFTTTSAATGDRALCCPPKDTSPPFEATGEGMQTTSELPNIQLTEGDIKFDAFGATGITATTPSNINSLLNEESDARIRIHTPSGVFKLVTT
tara:strand:- start:965 stop:3295 length:2331 start_codon:yes stop_codon:yes gene_type:complete